MPVRTSARVALALTPCCIAAVARAQLPPVVNLGSLDGSNGFAVPGIAAFDNAGSSATIVGDVSGDGYADILVGAQFVNQPPGLVKQDAGEAYLIYGGPGVGASGTLPASTLASPAGVRLLGKDAFFYTGQSVAAAGDVNGDGLADFLIGAPEAFYTGTSKSGEAYLVFGAPAASMPSTLALASLNGSNGVALRGVGSNNYAGESIAAAGDFDGDGYADVLVGAPKANSKLMPSTNEAGEAYLVRGGPGIGGSGVFALSSLTGPNGFTIDGIEQFDWTGSSVAGVGDVNRDGFVDLLIGAPRAEGSKGECYVVFGGSGVGASGQVDMALLTGANGFTIQGVDFNDRAGTRVAAAGDVDCDGVADMLIGARNATTGSVQHGEAYVVCGDHAIGASVFLMLSTLGGVNGFKISGPFEETLLGDAVAGLGDVNGDGVDDIGVGAPNLDPAGVTNAGGSYVIFGHPSVGGSGTFSTTSLDGVKGFALHGGAASDRASNIGGGGDVDGDGLADIVVGAYSAFVGGVEGVGKAYVFFGPSAPPPAPLPTLVEDTTAVSISQAGKLKLSLKAGPSYAGSLRLMLGSTSGIAPGLPVGSVVLPLNPDGYFNFTLANPNSPVLQGSFGFLDAQGEGTSWFAIPPGASPGLVGVMAAHAYAVIDLLTLSPVFASNAVVAVLVP